MFCSKCGYENIEGTRYCVKCGTMLLQEIQGSNQTVNPTETIAKSKNKTVIIIALIIVVIVISVFIVDKFCNNSKNGNNNPIYETTYSYTEIGDESLSTQEKNLYTGETFSFYAALDMNLNYMDSEEGCYFYEWEEVDGNVEIEVEIYNSLDGYNSSEFDALLKKEYSDALEADATYDTEAGVLKNGLPMIAVWQKKAEHDYYLEINTYTDDYYYEFQIFSHDEMYLVELYDAIKDCVIE